MSEAKRGLIRISANYGRLLTNVLLGLIVVPLLLRGIGNEGWALIALLGSTIGIVSVIRETARHSMIQELGAAYHGADREQFRSLYNAALGLSAMIAAVVAPLFAVIWLLVPVLKIPSPELVSAARWVVVAGGCETLAVLLTAAPFNMYKVTERMVAYNIWLVVNRSSGLVATVVVLLLDVHDDPARGVKLWVTIAAVMLITSLLIAAASIMLLDRRLVPSPATITRGALRSLLRIGGWNAAATAAILLHLRLAAVIMNLAEGLLGNLLIGVATRLTDAVRRLTAGMTEGVDAVAARLSTLESAQALRSLAHHSTRLHGFATFPVAIGLLFMVGPLLQAWVGNSIESPETTLPKAATLVRILTLGLAARSISDGWIRILYGAGQVRVYARLVVGGLVLNPLLAVLLLVLLPSETRYTAVGWAYSAVMVTIHGVLIPVVGARSLGLRPVDLLRPLLRPLVIAIACCPLLLLYRPQSEGWSPPLLVLAVGGYGVLYTVACVIFMMDRSERTRFASAAMRYLRQAGPRRSGT